MDAVQRPVAGSSILPPLKMDNSHVDNIWNRPALQQDQRRQQLQPDFRAKNEITAPGKTLNWVQSLISNHSINHLQQHKAFCLDDLCSDGVRNLQGSTMLQPKMKESDSSRNTG